MNTLVAPAHKQSTTTAYDLGEPLATPKPQPLHLHTPPVLASSQLIEVAAALQAQEAQNAELRSRAEQPTLQARQRFDGMSEKKRGDALRALIAHSRASSQTGIIR